MKEMVSPNRVLMENVLKSSFNLMLTTVNRYGEEHERNFKKHKKKFFKEINLDECIVSLVEKYPPSEMELNVFYIKRDGKSVWVKIKEGGDEAWVD
jgi:hypothetical protein